MIDTKKLVLAGVAMAMLFTGTPAVASGAEIAKESAADCHWTQDELIGGRWEQLYFCADVVGYVGSYQPGTHTYLDRADYGPNPTQWAGWIGDQVGTGRTAGGIAPGDHWWRVCSHDDGGPYLCTHWYHQ